MYTVLVIYMCIYLFTKLLNNFSVLDTVNETDNETV